MASRAPSVEQELRGLALSLPPAPCVSFTLCVVEPQAPPNTVSLEFTGVEQPASEPRDAQAEGRCL